MHAPVSLLLPRFLLTCLLALFFNLSVRAAESTLTDSEGKTAWLYTPTGQPDPAKTCWLVIGAHGAGGDGKGAGGIAGWAKENGDVIVLGPSFSPAQKTADEPGEPKADSYQMSGPAHSAKLKALVAEVGKTWKVHPKVFLHGFSAGAQFVHRFAMQNPELVAGVSAASAGSWSTRGFGEINPAARGIPFALSCGEADRSKSGGQSPLGRLDWMQEFAGALRKENFDVTARIIGGTGHVQNEDTLALAQACFARVRALNFSPTVMISADFNGANPLWDVSAEIDQRELKGATATATANWNADAGVIEKQNTSERTGALRLRANGHPSVKKWRAVWKTGLLSVKSPEANAEKLTLAFDLSVSQVQPVVVQIASFDANRQHTGSVMRVISPAAPNFEQRHTLHLNHAGTQDYPRKAGLLHDDFIIPAEPGEFNPADPWVQISFSISHDGSEPAAAHTELRVDNLCYSAPAFYVSPGGDDKTNDGRSEGKPFATPQRALDLAKAGDVIMLADGTYESDRNHAAAQFVRGGSPAAWITLRHLPGHAPVLRSWSWNTVKVGAGSKTRPSTAPAVGYVEVSGLKILGYANEVEEKFPGLIGKPEPETNGNGISFDGRYEQNKPHHLRIVNCEIAEACGGGISAIHCDRVSIEGNVCRENCHWMIYAGSGISVYQPFNRDSSPDYRILVRHNKTHDNQCTQPWVVTGKLSDGNGIIVDDTRNTQNESLNGVYAGRILIQNNLSYRNGGSGTHAFSSDHVDFINNTCVGNNTVMDYSQLGITKCSDCRVLNNIMVAPADKPVNRVNGQFSDILVSHNLLWGGNGQSVPGEHVIVADPSFINADKDDYRLQGSAELQEKSPALSSGGAWEILPLHDLDIKYSRSAYPPDRGACSSPPKKF